MRRATAWACIASSKNCQRARPAALARDSAESASRSRLSGVEVEVETAIPMEAVGTIRWPRTCRSSGDRGGHPFGAAFDLQDVLDVLDHDDELVPTEASDAIPRAQGRHDPVRDGGQHLVAGRVAKGVVDDLEVVQVHEQCPTEVPRRFAARRSALRMSRIQARLCNPVSGSWKAW